MWQCVFGLHRSDTFSSINLTVLLMQIIHHSDNLSVDLICMQANLVLTLREPPASLNTDSIKKYRKKLIYKVRRTLILRMHPCQLQAKN